MNNSLVELEASILATWPSHFDGQLHYCLGLSGGIDSVVLLHILARIRELRQLNLTAIHVNHGLSSQAQHWENFCQIRCQHLAIPLTICRHQVSKVAGQGLENSARRIRYQEYVQSQADVIILAHHQDDQIETMLSQLCRGSELHNLAGMRSISFRQGQYFWRPLLNTPKNQILNHAQQNHITHIEDHSNQDDHYLRNFMRNQILPLLQKFDPAIKPKLSNSIIQLQQAVDEIDALSQEDLRDCCPEPQQISIPNLAKLSNARQLRLLAAFLKWHNLALPSHARLSEFLRQVLTAAADRHPALQLSLAQQLLRQKHMIVLIRECGH